MGRRNRLPARERYPTHQYFHFRASIAAGHFGIPISVGLALVDLGSAPSAALVPAQFSPHNPPTVSSPPARLSDRPAPPPARTPPEPWLGTHTSPSGPC